MMLAAICLAAAIGARTQTPAPTPKPGADTTGSYNIISSGEIGVRGLDVNGDHEKYRSDLNYRSGVRIFDSSVVIEDNTAGPKPFDSALFQASGWGSDPTGSFRMNLDRTGIYKLDSSVRRVRYFSNLKNHVVNWSQPISTGSEHRFNTLHNFGDVDLTLFPERDFRIRLGYSFNNTKGPGTSTIRFRSDEFQVDSVVRSKSDDLRAGLEGKLLGFNIGGMFGHRRFVDGSEYINAVLNQGNNPATTTSSLNTGSRLFQIVGTTNFGNFYFQRTFADRFDVTGRLVHSVSEVNLTETDALTGRASATGDIIVLDRISVPGTASRPQTRGDLGFTLRLTKKFRISNTFTFDQFNVGGSNTLFELLQSTSSTGTPRADSITRTAAWRATSYRRLANLIEGDYQANRSFGFSIGYRFTRRDVNLAAFDRNLVTGATTLNVNEPFENSTNSVLAGARIKPTNNWTIYVDLERGESDTGFTRLANADIFSFRVRSRASVKQFSFNVSAITKNNDSPGTSVPIFSNTGVLLLPATETVANTKQSTISGSVDWNPRVEFGLSAGYTYTDLTSDVDVIVPVGTPIFTSTRFLVGKSQFFMRDSHFFFDINARPLKRVTVHASYMISDDRGQGDRIATRPEDIISSYPMRSQVPEIKVAFKITRNIDWNIGYQYYSYSERSYLNPFATPAVVFPAQNYTAHMPYTSVRFYFGGPAQDR